MLGQSFLISIPVLMLLTTTRSPDSIEWRSGKIRCCEGYPQGTILPIVLLGSGKQSEPNGRCGVADRIVLEVNVD